MQEGQIGGEADHAEGRLGRLALHLCADAGFVPDVVPDIGDMQAVFGLVSLGWGVALAPDLVPDRPGHPVVRVPLKGIDAVRHITPVVREGARNSPPVAALLPAVREAAGELGRPAWPTGVTATITYGSCDCTLSEISSRWSRSLRSRTWR
ncbi:LysR substrate-binding domain-containing protein [Streptomyces antibioticus]|uniref:LysR substrate-binding domain-containing protein n=1 Tax=Streptomyces antibioticus TaxID=1890 RepID=UPI0033CA6545